MSERCHICGPVKHEAPTVICAPCALAKGGHGFSVTVSCSPVTVTREELDFARANPLNLFDRMMLDAIDEERKYWRRVP